MYVFIISINVWVMQELAKEEGEESEAKLKEAIEILEGATFVIASRWRDFWRTIF